ncbi:hypothetical protein [Tautonia marina]|uniref:hypothetical protein n=1 Tax=Tautonia marina TaxID=2653855 RepID=UPI001260E037|nr:hypothetical protein [Tautonia marina]
MSVLLIQEPEPASARIEFEEIVRRSPVVLSVDPEISRVELRVSLTVAGVAISTRGLFRTSGDVVLMVVDDFDTTPIAWSDGKTVTVYDPIGQRLLRGATAGVAVRMLQLGDQGTLDIIVSATPETHDERMAEQGGPFLFDLRSIVEADRRERKDAERAPDGSIRTQILAPSGQRLDVTIDEVAGSTRWTARSVPRADGSAVTLSVLVNGPPEDRLFERSRTRPVIAGLPLVERVNAIRPGGRTPGERLLPFEDLDQVVRQVVEARAAIRQERNRDPLTPIIGDLGTQGGRLLLQDQRAAAQLRAFWGITSGGDAIP